MSRITELVLLLGIAVFLSGCENMATTPDYTGPANIPAERMAARMQYRGFAILRPDDARWFSNYHEQTPVQALFHFNRVSPTHTFFALVRNEHIGIDPASPEEFKKYIDAKVTAHESGLDLISYESESTTLQGQWCVRYKMKFLDKAEENADEPLLLTFSGFEVLHPSWKRIVISAMYSERGRGEEVTGELDKAGEDFLSKVVLEPAPRTKVGALERPAT